MSYNENDPEARRLLGLDGVPEPTEDERRKITAGARKLHRVMQDLAPEKSDKANTVAANAGGSNRHE